MDSHALQGLLGSNITRLRQLQSLTVEQLAEKSGVSTGHMMDVIHGRKWVSSSLLARVADVLGVPVHILFEGDKSGSQSPESTIVSLGTELSTAISDLIGETTKRYLKKN